MTDAEVSPPSQQSYQYFCKHSHSANEYLADCSTCVSSPICCGSSAAVASSQPGSGGGLCTLDRASFSGRCTGLPPPPACRSGSGTCGVAKHGFSSAAIRRTGKVFPYWFVGDSGGIFARSTDVRRIIVVLHGYADKAGDLNACGVLEAVKSQLRNALQRHVMIIAPEFYGETNDPLENELTWSSEGWALGEQSTRGAPHTVSSYTVIDDMLESFFGGGRFPNLRNVRLVGFSAGGQFVQKYALFGRAFERIVRMTADRGSIDFVVGSPNTLTYFDARRPVLDSAEVCKAGSYCNAEATLATQFAFEVPKGSKCNDTYNNYRYGLDNLPQYHVEVDLGAAVRTFAQKRVVYLVGSRDTCNREATAPCQRKHCTGTLCDGSCGANLQGLCRHMRLHAWFQYVDQYFGGRHSQAIYDVDVDHDRYMFYQSNVTRLHVVGTDADFF